MRKVYIMGACRTPIGKMGGVLSSLSAVELGSKVINEALAKSRIPKELVDHVYMGCAIQAGLGQNVARQASLMAGLPYGTTAETLNIVCGSGLDAVNSAAMMIKCGDADIVIAGGMESMSNAPFAIMKGRFGYRIGNPMNESNLIDTMVKDALWDSSNNCHMGITAENIAEKWGLTREEIDVFAVWSQNKACAAAREGLFNDEIIPIIIKDKKQDVVIFSDESPREGTVMRDLSKLKPVFKEGGVITAGNSSGINDGAAAVVVVSEEKVKELNLHPEAQWLGGCLDGVEPELMGIGPVMSTRKLLRKLKMTIDDIDLIEANEAFAAQCMAVQRELNIPDEKFNINGGAIALGHPVGASGCRILVTLIHNMKKKNKQIGLATLCIGGGMGCSAMICKC